MTNTLKQMEGMWLWLSKPFWIPFWLGLVNSPHILEPILVVGLGCSLGVRDFDPWPDGCVYAYGLVLLVDHSNGGFHFPSPLNPS